jgi:branched-chain amino acid transport system substrate-binding protein
MKNTAARIALSLVPFLLFSAPQRVCAEIAIGQTAGFTGVVAAGVKEISDGAKLYIDSVNARGGIGGQKIVLHSLDDKFDPKLAAENTRTLITEKRVVAMFLSRGTPHAEAMIPILDEFNIPLIAPSTGAMVLHTPLKKNVFNVRATYQREAASSIALLKSIGLDRIAVIYTDDSFGKDCLVGAETGFAAAKLSPVLTMKFDRAKPDFTEISAAVAKDKPNAVMVFGSSASTNEAVRAIRAVGSPAKLVTLSNNASAGFVKLLGEHASGSIVTQAFPSDRASSLFQEVTRVAKAKGIADVSPAMVEGYAGARVLVEGLKRAGANPTGPKITAALESLRGFDLGGLKINYSATSHTGLAFAELSIINKDGKFVR